MTDLVQHDWVENIETSLVIVSTLVFVWLLILSIVIPTCFNGQDKERQKDRREFEKEKQLTYRVVNNLHQRITVLEERLKAFEALERIGLASQLGEEMLARTDAEIMAMEQGMKARLAGWRDDQAAMMARMREEMERYRAETAGIGKR